MPPEDSIVTTTTSCSGDDDHYSSSSSSDGDDFEGAVVVRDDRLQEAAAPPPPSFGNVSVMNSSDVHFGNKTFYHGPVTIKQFLYANGEAAGERDDGEVAADAAKVGESDSGVDNPGFVREFPVPAAAGNKSGVKAVVQENSSGIVKGFRRLQKFSQGNMVVLVSLLAVLMVSLAILMVVLLLRHNPVTVDPIAVLNGNRDEQDKNTPIEAPIDPNGNLTLPGKLKLVSRLEWLAQPAVEAANVLATPVPYVIILHTATENCSSQAQCVFHVRFIQTFHIESRNWWDIGYNFLVGGDGEAYEGRGWKAEGAHTFGYNAKSIGIAFIGTFNSFKPPQRQITACKQLIAKGVELGYIKRDYKLLAARQLQTTQSPGAALYEDMKTWEHWAEAP